MRRIFIASAIFSFLFLGNVYAANENVFFYQAPSMPFTNSELTLNATKPTFDIAQAKQDINAVVNELQSIPIGGEKIYKRGDTQNISMEKIIDSLVKLGIIEFDVENATVNRINQETGKEETYAGGDFGFMLKECVLNYLPGENELKVIHKKFEPHPKFSPKYDTDTYELWINGRIYELNLCRNYFPIDKGLEWAIFNLLLKESVRDEKGDFIGTRETDMCFDFFVNAENPESSAYYIIRACDPDNNLLAYEAYKWEIGGSDIIGYRPWGPPDSK